MAALAGESLRRGPLSPQGLLWRPVAWGDWDEELQVSEGIGRNGKMVHLSCRMKVELAARDVVAWASHRMETSDHSLEGVLAKEVELDEQHRPIEARRTTTSTSDLSLFFRKINVQRHSDERTETRLVTLVSTGSSR